MKKIAIIILIAISFRAYSQEQEYDTIVYYPQTIFECPMLFDPVASPIYYDNSDEYYASGAAQGGFCHDYWIPRYHDFMQIALHKDCDSAWASIDQNYLSTTFSHKILVGFESMPGIRSYAQPYY